jgi:hypothetical protein
MSSKKSRGGGGSTGAGDDSEDLTRPPPLQATLLADSFTLKFRPITLERPKVPAPRTLPTHHHLEIRAHVALLNPSAGAAPASHKRVRDAAGEPASSEAGNEASNKRLRPEDLLDLLDDDPDAAAADDLASVMRSLEEIASFEDVAGAAAGELTSAPQPEMGFLLEASDDELGLPPAGGSSSSEEAGGAWEPEVAVET